MLTAIFAIAPLTVIAVLLTANSFWEGLVIAVGLLWMLVILKEWSLDGYPRRAVFVLIFTGVSWLVGALLASSPLNFVPFALVGSLFLARVPQQRLLANIGFSLGIGLIGATSLLTQQQSWALADTYVLLPIAGTLFIAGVVSVSERSWLLVRRLERAKEAEAELALAHERMRFAGDLHDIQGHSLHVIKLKAALAQRLVASDPARADAELAEIRGLVDDTITKTRELAYARHEIELMSEIENARRLCEATGIQVDVTHNSGYFSKTSPPHPLLAHVLRQATTNLLSYAHPTRVTITAGPGRVEISNDGVPERADDADGSASTDGSDLELRGLARLRERIELAGGELHITQTPGTFTVSATLESS